MDSNNHYLFSFDDDMFKSLNDNIDIDVDNMKKTVSLPSEGSYIIHDINWVVGNKSISKYKINKIDDQHIVI